MAIDIDQSHYNTGTATVAGTAVTGQGTAWLGAVRKGDLFGTHKGSGVRIASVDSNTGLTLAYAVAALEQTAAAYEIQRTPFDVGYLAAIENMIRLYGDGILPALATLDGTGGDKLVALTGAGSASAVDAKLLLALNALDGSGGDKLPYLSGANTAALTALSAFMRTVLAADDAAAARASLEAGTGDMLGSADSLEDEIMVFGDATGKRAKRGGKKISELVPGSNSVTNAILADMAANTFKARGASAGDPQDLTAAQALALLKAAGAYAKDNILGAVSQTAGVPTGEVLETGSNANGNYIRFADGTQVCWGRRSANVTTAAGSGVRPAPSGLPSPPAAFVGTFLSDYFNGAFYVGLNSTGDVLHTLQYGNGLTLGPIFLNTGQNTVAVFPSFTMGSTASASWSFDFIAIGRWF